MARVSKRWRLNMYVEPTASPPPPEHVEEALYALQVELRSAELERLRDDPLGSALATIAVALVKHLARHGSYLAVELDGPSLLDDAEAQQASRQDGLDGV